jgi:hypothetical protein
MPIAPAQNAPAAGLDLINRHLQRTGGSLDMLLADHSLHLDDLVQGLGLEEVAAPIEPVALGVAPPPPVRASRYRAARPHPIFTASIDDLLDRRLLANAKLTAWQYVVLQGSSPYGVSEIVRNPQGGFSYAASYPPECAKSFIRTISRAESSPQVAKYHYELRILRIPTLLTVAVWLHDPRHDLLLPVQPAATVLKGKYRLSEKAFTNLLIPVAQKRREGAALDLEPGADEEQP